MSGIIINEDFENFMVSYPTEKMTKDGIKEQIDHYAVGQVEKLFYCGNGMSAVFDSNVFEPLWYKLEDGEDGKVYYRGHEVTDKPLPVKTTAINCRTLHQNVASPFQTRMDYGRKKGLEMWISMRMNDIHWATDNDFLMNTDYWRNNPQLRRALYDKTSWSAQALDYGNEKVRTHSLKLIQEYFERFDVDGLELDWMRTPPHFRPGYEIEGGKLLNGFMRDVRSLADKAEKRLGHKIQIGIRIPSRPEDARLNGLDFLTWTKEKLVNLVVVTAYWASTDFNMPLELWKELLPEGMTLAAGLDILARPNENGSFFFNTVEIIAGYAASFFYRGADKIYLFNHMDGHVGMKDKDAYKIALNNIGEQKTAEAMSRRHLVTYTDIRAEGLAIDNILPLALSPEKYSQIRINLGGGTNARKISIIIGVRSDEILNDNTLLVRLNTDLCILEENIPNLELPENNWQIQAFLVSPESIHDGNNMIEIINNSNGKITVEWCEVYIEKGYYSAPCLRN